MRYVLIAALVLALLATSAPAREADGEVLELLKEIKAKIEKLEERLKKIEEKLEAAPPPASPPLPFIEEFDEGDSGEEAARAIQLPDRADKDAVRAYVAAIQATERNKHSYSPNDIQVRKLIQIGPENVDVLVEALSGRGHSFGLMDYSVIEALKRLAGDAHKEMIIDKLAEVHTLAEIIQYLQWEEAARDTLVGYMKTRPHSLPTEWIECVAALEDPGTYEFLKEYLIRGNNPRWTYQSIRHLPGIDLGEAVAEGWVMRKHQPFEAGGFAVVAVDFGHLDALELLIEALGKDRHGPGHIWDAHEQVFKHIDMRGTPEQVQEWFAENKDKLEFDPATMRYRVPK